MIRFLAVLFIMFSVSANATVAENTNNTMIKECLDVYGYDKSLPVDDRLNNFNWAGASGCVSNFNVEKHKTRIAEEREFLKKNPWFKGKNWKWQQRAEYSCNKVMTNAGWVEICHRPYYVN